MQQRHGYRFLIVKRNVIILFLLFTFPLVITFGQSKNNNYNFRKFDTKSYYFGLTFGYNRSDFSVYHSSTFILNDSFAINESLGGSGLNVGIIGNMKLGQYFDFRILPGFSFTNRKLFYINDANESEQTINFDGVAVQFPFQVRFKSDPFHESRLYVLLGSTYSFDLTATKVRDDQRKLLVRLSPHDFTIDLGAGAQFFFPFFIFSPELKFSQGIGNILLYNNELSTSRVIEKLISRTFTLSFHFEG